MPADLTCVLSFGLLCAPVAEDSPTERASAEPVQAIETTDDATDESRGVATLALVKVKDYYAGTQDLEASFKQTYTNPIYSTSKTSKGTLRARRPRLMVWDYDGADDSDYWVDQKQLHVVDPLLKQVIHRRLAGSDIAGAEQFIFGGENLLTNFKVRVASKALAKRYGSPGHTVVEMKPLRTHSHYARILLVVDDDSGRVDAFVVRNHDSSVNHFELSHLETNTGRPLSDFTFKRPAGFKQVEAPE